MDERLPDGAIQHSVCPPHQRVAQLAVRPSLPLLRRPRAWVRRRRARHGGNDQRHDHGRLQSSAARTFGCSAWPTGVLAARPNTAQGDAKHGHYTVETYTTTTGGAAVRRDHGPARRSRLRGDIGAPRGERAGVGLRPGPPLGAAGRADAGRRDGRRTPRAAARRRGEATRSLDCTECHGM